MAAQLKIAVVEDNDDLRDSLLDVLGAHGYRVLGFSCAEDLVDAPLTESFGLMILDLNLPGEDGLSLASRLKHVQPGLRVIMMTTRTALGDRVRGYDAGADLYLPKPVAEAELVAAVNAVRRQIASHAGKVPGGASGALRIDSRALVLRGPRGSRPLNASEVRLLMALARAPEQRLEHWQLLQIIGLDLDAAGTANLAVRMTRLRAKFSEVGGPQIVVRSLRTAGYQLCVELRID